MSTAEPWASGAFQVTATSKFSVIEPPQKDSGKKGGSKGGKAAAFESTSNAAGLYKRSHMRVKEFLSLEESAVGSMVTVKGWIRTMREQGGGRFAFAELNDGSSVNGIQVVLNKDAVDPDPATEGFAEAMAAGGTGSSMAFTGMVSKSPAKGQLLEIHAHSVTVLGTVIAKDYPMSKKRHTPEQLRKVAHLRARAKGHSSVMRVRHAMAYATHKVIAWYTELFHNFLLSLLCSELVCVVLRGERLLLHPHASDHGIRLRRSRRNVPGNQPARACREGS